MKPIRIMSRLSALSALVLTLSAPALRADLVYHLTFDSDFTNSGSAGGVATTTGYGGHEPSVVDTGSAPGLGNGAAQFTRNNDSAGGLLALPDSTAQLRLNESSSALTFSTWVYWEGAVSQWGDYGLVNTLNSSNVGGWGLKIVDDGKLRFNYTSSDGGNSDRTTSNVVITSGEWVNVVFTWDSSTDTALALYVGGIQVAINESYSGSGVLNTSAQPIVLGTANQDSQGGVDMGWGALNGSLDDVALWNAVLTDAQIRALATAPAALPGADAGVLTQLFAAFDSQAAGTEVNGLVWSYVANIDASGKVAGDLWEDNGNYYLLLDGGAGLVGSAIPELRTVSLLLGALALIVVGIRRR